MARLSTNDTLEDILIKMSAYDNNFVGRIRKDNNCYDFLKDLVKYCEEKEINFAAYVGVIDRLSIYADRLYILYAERCNQNIDYFIQLLNDLLNEKITEKEIKDLC